MHDEPEPHPQAPNKHAQRRAAFGLWTVVLTVYALAAAWWMTERPENMRLAIVFYYVPWGICVVVCWFATLIGAEYRHPHIGGLVALLFEIIAIPFGVVYVALSLSP